MKHVRAQIREYVANLLEAQGQFTAVYRSRTKDVARESLPAAIVYVQEEANQVQTQGANALHDRSADLVVEILVRSQSATDESQFFDEVADECALVVERALHTDLTLGGLAKFLTYTGMTSDYAEDQPEARVTLTWAVRYFVKSQNPETPK